MRNEEFEAGKPGEDISPHQKRLLDFAGQLEEPNQILRDRAIVTEFGYHPTTFYRRVYDMLSNPAAEAYNPQAIHRYQRVVDQNLTKYGHRPHYSGGTE